MRPAVGSWIRGPALRVPRWAVALLLVAGLLWIVARIASSPAVLVQRLDSPDGQRRALLLRTRYIQHHLQVRLREGGWSFVPYTSPPFSNDFRVDLGERLSWSEDGSTVFLHIGGSPVWSYEFRSGESRDINSADAW